MQRIIKTEAGRKVEAESEFVFVAEPTETAQLTIRFLP
jgi:hypothetical protein